jgi:hypothetical protein
MLLSIRKNKAQRRLVTDSAKSKMSGIWTHVFLWQRVSALGSEPPVGVWDSSLRSIKKRGRKPVSRPVLKSHVFEMQSPHSNFSPQSPSEQFRSPALASPTNQYPLFTKEHQGEEDLSESDVGPFVSQAPAEVQAPRSAHATARSIGTVARDDPASHPQKFQSRQDPSRSSFPGPLSHPEARPTLGRNPSGSIRRISQLISHPQHSAKSSSEERDSSTTFQCLLSILDASHQRSQVPELPDGDPRCRYKCLEPVLPLLHGILEAEVACDLLEFYFAEPDSSLFRTASPYILTHVLRKQSLLHPAKPRTTSSALLVTMLWVCVQTADMPSLLLPGWRGNVSEALRKLAMSLVHDRDRDHWHRASGENACDEDWIDS